MTVFILLLTLALGMLIGHIGTRRSVVRQTTREVMDTMIRPMVEQEEHLQEMVAEYYKWSRDAFDKVTALESKYKLLDTLLKVDHQERVKNTAKTIVPPHEGLE
jgi:hypothetical protein